MSSTAETTRDAGLVDQAAGKAEEAVAVAQEKAGELTSKGRTKLSEQLDERTTDLGSQARAVAEALRRSTQQMEGEGTGNAAQFATQAADQIERLGSYLESKNGDALLRDLEDFARRRPWMIAGLGLLGGIAASRFVKASAEQRYTGSQAQGQLTRAGGGTGYGDGRELR